MDERVGLIVKTKLDVFPDIGNAIPVKSGTKGMVFSILPNNAQSDEEWIVIFQSGEALDFNEYERRIYLDILEHKISGSDKNKIHNKKVDDVSDDIKKKRIKLWRQLQWI